jgi:hypothetical protein
MISQITIPKMPLLFVTAVLFAAFGTWIMLIVYDGYHYQIFMRDHGVPAEATIIEVDTSGAGRTTDLEIVYQYSPAPGNGISPGTVVTGKGDVSYRIWSIAKRGQKVPIQYDPNNPRNSALRVEGKQSNLELLWIGMALGVMLIVGVGVGIWILGIIIFNRSDETAEKMPPVNMRR